MTPVAAGATPKAGTHKSLKSVLSGRRIDPSPVRSLRCFPP